MENTSAFIIAHCPEQPFSDSRGQTPNLVVWQTQPTIMSWKLKRNSRPMVMSKTTCLLLLKQICYRVYVV